MQAECFAFEALCQRWSTIMTMAARVTTASQSCALLEVLNLGVRFRSADRQTVHAVKSVSFSLQPEKVLAVVGESGSGKSVSAMAIMGLLPLRSSQIVAGSSIRFKGESLLELDAKGWRKIRGRKIAMIFQDPMSSLNPVLTVGEQLAEMLWIHEAYRPAQAMIKAQSLLEEVGIPEPARRLRAYPHELSGGQQQRVMIAMAIACGPEILIADEPTTALDVSIQRQILELLLSLKQSRRMSMIFISHDLGLVGEFADEIVVMRHGEVREAGSTAQIFTDPRDSYTKALIHCRPDPARPRERLLTIDDWFKGSAHPAAALPAYPASPIPALVPSSHEPGASWKSLEPSAPTDPEAAVVLEVKGLRKVFHQRMSFWHREETVAVDDISFCLRKGQTLGIVGESGSGKTTAGLCAVRLLKATAGVIRFDGLDLVAMTEAEFHPLKRRLQIVFQNPFASLNPRLTVGQIISEPMLLHRIGSGPAERQQRVMRLLDQVGLPGRSVNRYPHEFSGGQRQRIAIARCLSLSPDVIVCDEAVSALDVSVQAQVLNLLKDLQREYALSYLFISHDLAVVRYMSDDVLVMHQGRVVEHASAEAIYARPQHAYTKSLLQAVPRGFQPQAAP